ncbi:MAG: sulfotransferase family 2 domain-containing protein [Proteobacteria bacterium]|nr:sulfotransferase family 2 domain-containing protein [Pseudomonadota bacterium]HQR04148.1 hypothetical protein [Rhodocyclaceae bacterium]
MRKLRDLRDRLLYRHIAHYRLPGGKRRVYFHHVRKTAGTSLCQSALVAAAGVQANDGNRLWGELWGAHRHRLAINGKVFVAGNRALIEEGFYYFAASHLPAYEIALPPDTFAITCLRDPVRRVLSHYSMLVSQRATNGQAYRNEGHWLGAGFDDFLERIPAEHLLGQLHTFSASFDPDEAFSRITACDLWFFTEELDHILPLLSQHMGLSLPKLCANRSPATATVTPQQIARLRAILAPELALHARLKAAALQREGIFFQPQQQYHQRIGQPARTAML